MSKMNEIYPRQPSMLAAIDAATSADYHTDYDFGDSHSSLELFRESPARYAAIRVFRTMHPDPPTPAMKVGQALHSIVLEYDKQCQFSVCKRRPGRQAPSIWNASGQLAKQTNQLSEKEFKLLSGMFLAIANEPDAWNLLVAQPGWNEKVFSGIDSTNSLQLKCKPDRVLENGLVVDLKTVDGAVDPSSWSRTLEKRGYHRQAAFYLDVLQAAGQKADMFVFVAISKEPRHEIGIYPIGEKSLALGREENRVDLEWLAECRRTGIWKHEWQGKMLTVDVPRWAIDK